MVNTTNSDLQGSDDQPSDDLNDKSLIDVEADDDVSVGKITDDGAVEGKNPKPGPGTDKGADDKKGADPDKDADKDPKKDGDSGSGKDGKDPADQPDPPEQASPLGKHYYLGTSGDETIDLTQILVYVDAGAGLDTVVVDGSREDATFKFDGFDKPVMTVPGYDLDTTLVGVERIQFDDGLLALDTEGNSGQAYRLYQASFDRTPDDEGLEFWMTQLDSSSVSLTEVASHFLDSEEFTQTYGDNDTLSDADFLNLLYLNVLNREADQAGYDFWRLQQENGLGRDEMLVYFSESEENKANVSSAIDDGIWFS